MNLEALCEQVVAVTIQSGREIWLKAHDLTTISISEKGPGDVATDIDLWAEHALRDALTNLLRGSQFFGE